MKRENSGDTVAAAVRAGGCDEEIWRVHGQSVTAMAEVACLLIAMVLRFRTNPSPALHPRKAVSERAPAPTASPMHTKLRSPSWAALPQLAHPRCILPAMMLAVRERLQQEDACWKTRAKRDQPCNRSWALYAYSATFPSPQPSHLLLACVLDRKTVCLRRHILQGHRNRGASSTPCLPECGSVCIRRRSQCWPLIG
jgi:hypothetical protein